MREGTTTVYITLRTGISALAHIWSAFCLDQAR